MPAWPGGPCPDCGEQIPANVIRCVSCRALLNSDLEIKPIAPPEFIPLPELHSYSDSLLRGLYLDCPQCRHELRINLKLMGQRVQCRFCHVRFELQRDQLQANAGYSHCPHCRQEIRAAMKYVGIPVSCRFCHGAIRLIEPSVPSESE